MKDKKKWIVIGGIATLLVAVYGLGVFQVIVDCIAQLAWGFFNR